MSLNFFEKLILRARGRLPVVVPKLETMLTPGRRAGTMPELALSGVPELALSQPAPPLAGAPRPAAQPQRKDGGDDGKGGTGGGTEGGAGSGGGALGPPPGEPSTGAGARARAAGVHRETVSPVEISIGKLEIHAAPNAPRPAPVRRSRPGPPPVPLHRRR
jgi:hypothetical protein